MKKLNRKLFAVIMVIAVMAASVGTAPARAASKKKPSLSKKSVTLTITNKKKSPSATLKVKNAGAKKVKWKISNAKIASIKAGKNNSIKITAKKAGKAAITCKVGGKKLTCKVTVKDKRKADSSSNNKAKNTAGECRHNWVEKWTVIEKEADYPQDQFPLCICSCGETFDTVRDYQIHYMVKTTNMGMWSELTDRIGIHGTAAHGGATNTTNDDGTEHVEWRWEYIEYCYCTKCNEKTMIR